MARSNQQFDAFVKRQQRRAREEKRVDWTKEREDWISNLNRLYEKIASFLDEYVQNGSIRIETQPLMISEPDIGTYQAERQVIHIGPETITLTPIGAMLVGSKGRVDVKGSAGSARLLLVDKNMHGTGQFKIRIAESEDTETAQPSNAPIEWAWKIATPPPEIRYNELSRASLQKLLLEVSNG